MISPLAANMKKSPTRARRAARPSRGRPIRHCGSIPLGRYLPAVCQSANGFVCKSGQSCGFSNWKARARAEVTVLLKKSVSHAEVPLNAGFTYKLYYAAAGTDLDKLRILDVLPYAGDGRATSYAGTLKLTAPIRPRCWRATPAPTA